MSARKLQALQQTNPKLLGARGGVPTEPDAFRTQMEPVIEALKRDGELTQPVRQMLIAGEGDQIHHINGLRVLGPLFENNTAEQNAQLRSMLPTGHNILNFMSLPQRAHQGIKDDLSIESVHNLMRSRGLETNSKASVRHPVLDEINMAGDMLFEYKRHLMDQYIDEVNPKVKDAIDDALTDYETRFAGDAIESLLSSIRNTR